MARRKLIPGKICLWGHEIAVDWADPEPGDPINDEVMLSVRVLFFFIRKFIFKILIIVKYCFSAPGHCPFHKEHPGKRHSTEVEGNPSEGDEGADCQAQEDEPLCLCSLRHARVGAEGLRYSDR